MDWYIKQQHEQHEQLRQRQLDLQHQQEAARQRIKMKQREEAPVGQASQVWRNNAMYLEITPFMHGSDSFALLHLACWLAGIQLLTSVLSSLLS